MKSKQYKIKESVYSENENVMITPKNVRFIGERIALSAVRKMRVFAHYPKSLDKLYEGLVADIFRHNSCSDTFSDGYDIASEVICFLCEYIGHYLDDEICKLKRGKVLSVRYASYRHALRYIEKEYLTPYKNINLEDWTSIGATVDFETQIETENESKVDTIIRQMRLTADEAETLNYYMAGWGFVAIANMMNVNNTTVWRRRKSIQRKYNQYVAVRI